MIANFFKQSKPIVFIILGIILSALFYTKVFLKQELVPATNQLIIIIANHLLLICTFVLFEISVRRYEIQKGHSLASLFFVLFIILVMPDLYFDYTLLGFLILSLGIIRAQAITESAEKNICIFESVFLITVSGFFYQPFILCLILILPASILFSRPKWRFFVIPVLSISSVVILVEAYYLIRYNAVTGLDDFIPTLENSVETFILKLDPVLSVFWVISAVVCIYQIIKVKRIRSLYHRDRATFFLIFILLAFFSSSLKSSTMSGLWLMSIWPFCIYLGDFISRIKKQLWLQIWFLGFILVSISIYLYELL